MCSYRSILCQSGNSVHDDVIKWKHFRRHWPFVRGIHRSPVNSPHKGQWRGASMFSSICAWINGWVNNIVAGESETPSRSLRCHCNYMSLGPVATTYLPDVTCIIHPKLMSNWRIFYTFLSTHLNFWTHFQHLRYQQMCLKGLTHSKRAKKE